MKRQNDSKRIDPRASRYALKFDLKASGHLLPNKIEPKSKTLTHR